jgi:hypothetical protein
MPSLLSVLSKVEPPSTSITFSPLMVSLTFPAGISLDLANNKTPTKANMTSKKIAILEIIVVVLNIIICLCVLNEL